MTNTTIVWFRRDLRLHDNAGLYHALRSGIPVLPLFIFDEEILEKLPNRKDARVEFIHAALTDLHADLEALGTHILADHPYPYPYLLQQPLQYTVGLGTHVSIFAHFFP